jgi:hypothetical protein
MTDVFDVLGRDHEEVKQMLSRLEDGPTARVIDRRGGPLAKARRAAAAG